MRIMCHLREVPSRASGFFIYFLVAGFLLCLLAESAQAISGAPGSNTNTPLDSWSFSDTNNWTSDLGYAPVSFTNLSASYLGNFDTLMLDSTNPAWLQFNVIENDGTTNLTVDVGSVIFWFAPDWSGTNEGGTGPGEWGRLLEAGSYTPDSSYGWWSIYVDDGGNYIYFSAQTNDGSGITCTYLSAPIDWTTNYWHFIALTYSATNTALYLDGELMTNGPPLTVFPGPDVLANGFYIGSDSNGVLQARGMFCELAAYNCQLDAGMVGDIFNQGYSSLAINPWNIPYMDNLVSAPFNPSTNAVTPDVITGPGYLQWVGSASACVTNVNSVWITNMTATAAGDGTINVTFTIQGGQDGYAYDVFGTGALQSPLTNAVWSWLGQGYHCNTYTLTNISNANAFFILGTPLDSDSDGLTEAYELLVSHTDPHNAYSNLDGLLDGWDVLLGLKPQTSNLTQPGTRANYTYNLADWLNQVSGVKSGTISLDNEGNVQSISQ